MTWLFVLVCATGPSNENITTKRFRSASSCFKYLKNNAEKVSQKAKCKKDAVVFRCIDGEQFYLDGSDIEADHAYTR